MPGSSRAPGSYVVELGLPLLAERLDALAEVVRLLQEPVREPFQLEPRC